MKLLRYLMIFSFLIVFAELSKAGHGKIEVSADINEQVEKHVPVQISPYVDRYNSTTIVAGVIICPDSDGDGFFDDACGGFDCDDSDKLVNPDAVEICNDIDDDDDDLVDDIIEDGAPNDGDGNNDGTPDSWQKHVISIPNAVDGKYVTLETDPEHKLFAAMAVGNPSSFNDPQGVSFPFGFFEFEIELTKHGEESYIILYLPEGVVINTFYKFGPTPDNPQPHWYDFIFDGETGAQFLEDRVVLRFVDGKRGDDDITINGLIFEPGGPGFVPIELEDIDLSGCSLASSSNQASSNVILNLLILFIPFFFILFAVLRRKMKNRI